MGDDYQHIKIIMTRRTLIAGIIIGAVNALASVHVYFFYQLRQAEGDDRQAILQIISIINTARQASAPAAITK